MKTYNKITISTKLSKDYTLKNVYLFTPSDKVTATEMANTLTALVSKGIQASGLGDSSNHKIKIQTVSYKRVPKKYFVI